MDLIITFGLLTLVILLEFVVVPAIVLKRVTKFSTLYDYPIYIVNSNEVNAYSLNSVWGKFIVITRGLVNEEDEEHVRAAIMHELGHLKLNHHVKMSLYIISVIIAFTYLLNLNLFVLIPFGLFALFMQRYFQRRFELSADKFALRFTNRRLLEDLITKYDVKETTFLSTHPNIHVRLKNIDQ
ncbi:peptidase M48 Ste24p [Sulfolobus islandicus Y.G.57.14]|uniref:Peptidase M48 Ste24p n=4 Tax=Saccharolobus islandicus TaxID=43080 RepID=C3MJX4_SACI2|nr:M48 family metallopeptidase [Sulfolobus islandicus]ACP36277.1 peptidase M48 Ste24p [Sulfolobus islandicus L.S.2.15]ACP46505.1 peptidase M48 Ste24p [Sulfolobus islandicus Y.G.57.14]ACP47789.1 peptidase M48 Ste24p [Sulfolobus islandicus Y.N.15.51]ADB88038.1 peptidase M48, Ste24p [Sulfolobus islandicus L.D.8.5]